MNEELIAKWNAKVGVDDFVIHGGDFCFGDPSRFIPRLNGKITLVEGNHDKNTMRFIKQNPSNRFRIVRGITLTVFQKKVLIYHYPVWQDRYSNWPSTEYPYDILLYGHVHNGNESRQGPWNTKNISLEVMNYEPQELEVVVDTILKNIV
jgi:calcineurin-like phosphoesterase family protein